MARLRMFLGLVMGVLSILCFGLFGVKIRRISTGKDAQKPVFYAVREACPILHGQKAAFHNKSAL